MPTELLEVMYQGLRVFYIIGLPIIIVLSLASIFTSVLQTALGMQEHTFGYAARLVALLVLLYMFVPRAAESLAALARLAFQ